MILTTPLSRLTKSRSASLSPTQGECPNKFGEKGRKARANLALSPSPMERGENGRGVPRPYESIPRY